MAINLLLIIGAAFVLIKAVDLFIESSSKLAQHYKISAYTISFFLVAIATSLPETVIGVTAALSNNSLLSYGNAIGSNIALVTLVIALPVLFSSGISTRTILRSKDIYFSIIFALVPIALILDGVLSRIDGGALLIGYAIYGFSTVRQARGLERIKESLEQTNVWKQAVIFVIGLILLLGSSEVIVQSAIKLSVEMGLTLTFIGLTLTAIGTSLPEIAFAMGAIKGRHQQEILGNIVGSVVANSTLVLGITSIINPIILAPLNTNKLSTISFLVISLVMFVLFAKSEEKIKKIEAFILLCLYAVFVVVEYQFSGI